MKSILQKCNVRTAGSGDQTLLFVHGLGCDQSMWRYVAPALTERSSVALLDLVGFGKSDHSAFSEGAYRTLQRHAEDVCDVAEALGRKCILVGHSVGATIGILADLAAPDLFSGHVMFAPSPRYINDGEYVGGFTQEAIYGLLKLLDGGVPDWAAMAAPLIIGDRTAPHHLQELQGAFCRARPEAFNALAKATFLGDIRDKLGQIRKPVTIVQCDDDLIAPPSVGRYMHAAIPGSSLTTVSNHGHCPQITNPGACIRVLHEALDEMPPQAAEQRLKAPLHELTRVCPSEQLQFAS